MTKLSTNVIRTRRVKDLFNWLYIFKFTSYELAFAVTKQKANGGYRFIRDLIEEGFLVRFNNIYMGKQVNLISLTSKGVKYLKAYGLVSEDAPYIRLQRYKNSSRLVHDLMVQKVVKSIVVDPKAKSLRQLDMKVEWEKEVGNIRVDALIYMRDRDIQTYDQEIYGIWAIELERTEKSKQRTDYLFKQHDQNILDRKYHRVMFRFADPKLKATYEDRFNSAWDNYVMTIDPKTKQKGKLKKLSQEYVPQRKQRFLFC